MFSGYWALGYWAERCGNARHTTHTTRAEIARVVWLYDVGSVGSGQQGKGGAKANGSPPTHPNKCCRA